MSSCVFVGGGWNRGVVVSGVFGRCRCCFLVRSSCGLGSGFGVREISSIDFKVFHLSGKYGLI